MLLDELVRRCENPINWDEIFATIVVTNSISTDPGEIRGLVTMCVGNNEIASTYFGDICQAVREYENLAQFHINERLDISNGLRQFIDKLPNNLVLIGTNVEGWLKPLLTKADEEYQLFDGRTVAYVDLGQFASINKATDILQGSSLDKLLPQNKFRGRSGSLGKLASAFDLPALRESIGAEKRAHTIVEVLRKHLERELRQ